MLKNNNTGTFNDLSSVNAIMSKHISSYHYHQESTSSILSQSSSTNKDSGLGETTQTTINSDDASSSNTTSPERFILPLHSTPQNVDRTQRKRQRRMHSCDYCEKQFDRPSLLKRHTLTHTGERPFDCSFCGKGFSTRSGVNTHERTHTGQRPYECNICGRKFAAGSNLIFHKYTHSNVRKHACSQCPKAFLTPGDLKKHEYSHTGNWPYRCEVCHRGFATQRHLTAHEMIHSGRRPFTCTNCGKSYAQDSSLKTHLRSCHQTHEVQTAFVGNPSTSFMIASLLDMTGGEDEGKSDEQSLHESIDETSSASIGQLVNSTVMMQKSSGASQQSSPNQTGQDFSATFLMFTDAFCRRLFPGTTTTTSNAWNSMPEIVGIKGNDESILGHFQHANLTTDDNVLNYSLSHSAFQ